MIDSKTCRRLLALAASAACTACVLAALPAQAAVLDASSATVGSRASAVVSGQQLSLDLSLAAGGSATYSVLLDAADLGQWLRLDAVVGLAAGAQLSQLRVALDGAEFAFVGSVTPGFGQLAGVDGDAAQQRIAFSTPETLGLDLGAPFGQAGGSAWLLAPTGTSAGDIVSLTISAVPEPATLLLCLGALGGLALSRRRKAA